MIDAIQTKKMENAKIISTKITFQDKLGRNIKGYIDRADGLFGRPMVIISPGYGEIKRDYISTAYYLACNNFIVVRYDNPNHLGESDGDILNFKLSDIEHGILGALDYVEKEFGMKKMGLIASSLSGRVAIKLAGIEERIKYIIGLTSVINLKDTLFSLYKEDLISQYKKGKRWGALDILGFEVKDDFLKETISKKYDDLDSTIKDMETATIPVCFMAAGNDAWVNYKELESVYSHTKNKQSELIEIPGALHQIQENPKLAKMAILKIVQACLRCSDDTHEPTNKLFEPPISYIVRQNKAEIASLKTIFTVKKSDEKKFWVDYLSKYFVLIKSNDYQNLLSLAAQLLGEIKDGERILDAGCGNGHFGAWLLFNMETELKRSNSRFSYTGMDFTESALSDAEKIHTDIVNKIFSKDIGTLWLAGFNYVLADLEEDLPAQDMWFDKICCNLVISYLKKPSIALKNLHSKLKRGGKFVVSSLKPYSDLSLIYKDYVDQNLTEEDILEGRRLLSSAGKIRHKEKHGHYYFYDEKELIKIVEEAGFTNTKVYRGFGNQANIAIAEKI